MLFNTLQSRYGLRSPLQATWVRLHSRLLLNRKSERIPRPPEARRRRTGLASESNNGTPLQSETFEKCSILFKFKDNSAG